MEAKELMTNDWVFDGSINIQLTPENIFDIYVGNWDEPKPIPLTEEILNINGFIIERSREYYFIYYSKNDEIVFALEYDVEQKDYWVHLGGYSNAIFKYVHELQHILRLCGLSDLANNFKIQE